MNFGLAGSVIGAVSTAGVAWKYSRSVHGNSSDSSEKEYNLLVSSIFSYFSSFEVQPCKLLLCLFSFLSFLGGDSKSSLSTSI